LIVLGRNSDTTKTVILKAFSGTLGQPQVAVSRVKEEREFEDTWFGTSIQRLGDESVKGRRRKEDKGCVSGDGEGWVS
jgi:hypothetical protein